MNYTEAQRRRELLGHQGSRRDTETQRKEEKTRGINSLHSLTTPDQSNSETRRLMRGTANSTGAHFYCPETTRRCVWYQIANQISGTNSTMSMTTPIVPSIPLWTAETAL